MPLTVAPWPEPSAAADPSRMPAHEAAIDRVDPIDSGPATAIGQFRLPHLAVGEAV